MKNKKIIMVALVIITMVIIIVYAFNKSKDRQVDECHDKGGSWNYELKRCEPIEKVNSINPASMYWRIEYDTLQNREYLVRGEMMDSYAHSIEKLIEVLNERAPESKIEYVGQVKDTVQIRILNDHILSEQMGSTGAYCFLAETVYTLTEPPAISFVRIHMNHGSHASPGIYQRVDFKDLIRKEE